MRLSRTEKPKWEAPKRSEGEIPYCPHPPQEKQRLFLDLNCPEALFGGAAGGGKSDALLMAALQYVEVPGYAALLLRKTYADLVKPGALMDRAGDWLRPTAARWREQRKTWEFPSGATLSFGFIQHENDKFNWQSSELDYVGFDELSQFSETSYVYLFSRIRQLDGGMIPWRMRGATNPGSEWVKTRFNIRNDCEDDIQWTEGYWVEDQWVPPRAFVRSLLSDNAAVDAKAYRASMANLDPFTRQQLLKGDWDVRPEGALFKRHWFEIVDAVPAAGQRVRFWDMASTARGDYSVGLRMVRDGGRFVVEDVQRGRWTPHERDAVILQTARLDGHAVKVVIEQEPGSAGVSVIDQMIRMLAGYPVEGRRATGDKITRAAPLASQAEAGNVKLLSGGWTAGFLDELSAFPTAGVHDDQVDAASGAFGVLCQENVNPLLGTVAVAGVKGWNPR